MAVSASNKVACIVRGPWLPVLIGEALTSNDVPFNSVRSGSDHMEGTGTGRGKNRTYSVQGVEGTPLDAEGPRLEWTRWQSRYSMMSLRVD